MKKMFEEHSKEVFKGCGETYSKTGIEEHLKEVFNDNIRKIYNERDTLIFIRLNGFHKEIVFKAVLSKFNGMYYHDDYYYCKECNYTQCFIRAY